MKFATNTYGITHLTLGMLLHYLLKWKIQIFRRYLADMEENANKFLIFLVWSVMLYGFYSNFISFPELQKFWNIDYDLTKLQRV